MSKLVILAPSFYSHRGGVEKHLENVVKLLVDRGWEVTVLVRYAKDYPKLQKVFGARVVRMPRSIGKYAIAIWLIKNKYLFEEAVVHSHDYFPFALRKALKDLRWVHTFHGYEGYPLDPDAIKSRQEVAKQVDYSFCVGGFIEKWYGTKCDSVIYGAANKPIAKWITPKWDYIFYGRFEDDTGFEHYMKAFKLIQQKLPKLSMLAVGAGSKHDWAKDYIAQNKLNITLHSSVDDINNLLSESRVAFVSGYLSIIECGLARKPIVAYYGTPIKKDYLEYHPMAQTLNIVDSEQGIATKAISCLKPNTSRINRLYEWSINQSWDRLVEQYIRAYQA